MWVVGAVRSQVDVPIWQKRATRVAACLLSGGPDVPAKADGPPPRRQVTKSQSERASWLSIAATALVMP